VTKALLQHGLTFEMTFKAKNFLSQSDSELAKLSQYKFISYFQCFTAKLSCQRHNNYKTVNNLFIDSVMISNDLENNNP
jgi:hypothetical protein